MQSVLERAFGKPRELVTVDMHAKLEEAGLEKLFPVSSWPPTAAVVIYGAGAFVIVHVRLQVRELATRIKTLKKAGETHPYVFVELRKYVVFRPCCAAVA